MVIKHAPEGQEFLLHGEKPVRSIEELLDYLEECSDEEFSHHVTEDRNDYAEWIKNVHDRDDLADKLEQADGRKESIAVLRRAVRQHYEEEVRELGEEDEEAEQVTREDLEPKVKPTRGDFLTIEFVYGMIFGFVLALIALGMLNAIG